jgi:flavin-dependent dehydrogenase
MYDIAIIGAGPAGATLARLIGNRYKILLLDRRELDAPPRPESFIKCCGGLLAPDAQKILARFGLGVPGWVLTGPQLFAVRTIDLEQGIERYYQRYYLNIDREKFDRWLVSLIPTPVDCRFNVIFQSYEMVKSNPALYKITYRSAGKLQVDYARIIVGADGAFSKVRRQAQPHSPISTTYFAVQEWLASTTITPYYSAIFDRMITGFYCWTIPKDDLLIIGAALPPDHDAIRRFRDFKEKLEQYGFQLGRVYRREGAFLLRPENIGQVYTGSQTLALIGEAAGWISPSSAEGISYALRSSLSLANALSEGPEGFQQRYRRSSWKLYANLAGKHLKTPFMHNPWLRQIGLRSGLCSLHINKTNENNLTELTKSLS